MGSSITFDHVLDALGLMLVFTLVSVSVVGGLMYWLYRFFKNKESDKLNSTPPETH
jgi:uncharacterized membrane-anchored protein